MGCKSCAPPSGPDDRPDWIRFDDGTVVENTVGLRHPSTRLMFRVVTADGVWLWFDSKRGAHVALAERGGVLGRFRLLDAARS